MKNCGTVLLAVLLLLRGGHAQTVVMPTSDSPLVTVTEKKEVQVFGIISPSRFNAAQGEEAHYHLLVWNGGKSPHALIETPADDLAFHDELLRLGAQPGDNLTMAVWNERHNPQSPAPLTKVTGSTLDVRISWQGNSQGISVGQAFLPSAPRLAWRFGGNRERWFNRVPFAPRPGCLLCLYSCPSGKVSNAVLSVHDYVTLPSRFVANTDILPPDGTSVIVTVRVLP